MHFAPISPILMEPTPKDPKFYLVGRAGWRNRKTQPSSNCEFFFSNFHCNFKNFSTAKKSESGDSQAYVPVSSCATAVNDRNGFHMVYRHTVTADFSADPASPRRIAAWNWRLFH